MVTLNKYLIPAIYLVLAVMLPSAKGQDAEGEDSCPNGFCTSEDDKIVYIIRHGEKIFVDWDPVAYKFACLSSQGWARAYNLKTIFGKTPRADLKTPDKLFSYLYQYKINEYEDCTFDGWDRTEALIRPLALELDNMTIDSSNGAWPDLCGKKFDVGDCTYPKWTKPSDGMGPSPHNYGICCNTQAADSIKSALNQNDVNVVLASWEHANINHLATALGASCQGSSTCSMDNWSGDNYDQIYALHFDRSTLHFKYIDTNLTQGFEWLGPKIYNSTAMTGFTIGEHPDIN